MGIVLFPLVTIIICTEALARDELFITVGQQQLIAQERKIKRVAVGNAAILKVKTIKNDTELLLTGKSAGTTDLIVWSERGKKTFTVNVMGGDSSHLLPAIKSFLNNIEGVSVRQVGDELWIEGELLRPLDRLYVKKIVKASGKIRDMTRMHTGALKLTMQQMQKRLQESGFGNLKISAAGNSLFVEGTLPSQLELRKVKQILGPIYPDLEYQIDTVYGHGDMIMLDIKMVEMRKSALKKLGIEWQKQTVFNADASWTNNGNTASLGFADPIPITINTLEQKGLARILANPKLTCKFDLACRFQAGGQIPIPLIGERVVQLIYKDYGILLSLISRRAADDMLVIEIDSEFSDLNQATAVNGVPGILRNTIRTTAAVRYNRSVVLSGLVTAKQGKNIDKVPVLGSVPILGELFKSRSFNRDESEFLLFLTPIPMLAGDSLTQEMISAGTDHYDEIGKKLNYDLDD